MLEPSAFPFHEAPVLRTVGSFVGAGFSYLRILHPAWTADGAIVRWDQLYAAVTSSTTWAKVAGDKEVGDPSDVWHARPDEGFIPDHIVRRLLAACGENDLCWAAIWSGWGRSRVVPPGAAMVRVEDRDYWLARASARELADSSQRVTMLWPDNMVWFAATDIELNSTYVRSAEFQSKAWLADGDLEVHRVGADAPLAFVPSADAVELPE